MARFHRATLAPRFARRNTHKNATTRGASSERSDEAPAASELNLDDLR